MPTISDLRKLAEEYGCLVHFPDDTDTGDRLQSVTEPIIKVLTKVKNLRKKQIDELEDKQTLKTEYFVTNPARSILLIFLYCCGDNLGSADEAREKLDKQIECVLEKDPQNITALLTKSKVFLSKGNTSCVKKILNKLDSIRGEKDKENLHKIICTSEVAFAYSRIHPLLYRKAIEKYDVVLDLYENASEEVREILRSKSYAWYYILAKTHSFTLNGGGGRGGVAQRPSDGESSSVGTVYEKICKLLLYVIEADDAPYKGRAMILLVETFKKCSKFTQVDFPYLETLDSFVERTIEECPTDPYVMVRCAEQFRQRAWDTATLKRSVDMFDKALSLNSDRHDALHKKGRALRSLWLETGNYEEAMLHRGNKSRNGNNQPKQVEGKPSKLNQGDCETASESARPPRSFAQSVSLQERVQKQNFPTPVAPQTAPASLHMPRLKYPNTQRRAPMQKDEPQIYDKMRVSNPAVDSSNDESKQYLVAAEKCFRKACELTHNSVCPYLIELGRALISLGRKEEALKTFEIAKEHSGFGCNTYDSAYLHEQLALLRHKMLIDRKPEDYDTELDDVMNLYREAIGVAMAAKMRSKMAYYKLRDILFDRKTKDPGNKAFSMEYDVLYTTTHKRHEKTAEILVETLQQNEETYQTAVRLVKLLLNRNWEMDASIAFVYLAALRQAGRLDLKSDCEERRELRAAAVEIAKRLDDGDKRSDACLKSVEVFKWLIGEETMASFGYKNDPGTCTQGTFHVCVLAPSESFEPLVPRVIDILTNHMNLQVCTAFFEGNGDVFGNGPWVGIESLISQSICMCVVEDSGHRKWRLVETFLDDLLGKKAPNVFLVSDHEIADTTSSSFCQYANTWPRLAISRDPAAKHLTCALLERALDLKMMA